MACGLGSERRTSAPRIGERVNFNRGRLLRMLGIACATVLSFSQPYMTLGPSFYYETVKWLRE